MYKVKFYDFVLDEAEETLSAMNDFQACKEAWRLYMVDAEGEALYRYCEDYSLGYGVINPDGKVIWTHITGQRPPSK